MAVRRTNWADEDVATGDPVVLLGPGGAHSIDAAEIAARIGTISYQVLCGVSLRVPGSPST